MTAALIRPVTPGDLPVITRIYADHVRDGVGSFEVEPPDDREMTLRVARVTGDGLPWLVAESGGAVAGFCYAGPHKAREGYRFTVEDSVYVDQAHRGRGLGRALLGDVIARCQDLGFRQMMAVIGDSGNDASIALHRALGFELIGVARDIGFKHGRHVDVVYMQKDLRTPDVR